MTFLSNKILFIWKTRWKIVKIYHQNDLNDDDDMDHFNNLYDHRWQAQAMKIVYGTEKKTQKHQCAHFRGLPRETYGVDTECGLVMANRYMACVWMSLSHHHCSLVCFCFIWRIYGDFYHKYFAMLILFAIVWIKEVSWLQRAIFILFLRTHEIFTLNEMHEALLNHFVWGKIFEKLNLINNFIYKWK